MNVLEQVLTFIGSSVVSGVTWDVLRMSGTSIIRSFKQKFLSKGFFTSEEQAEKYLETVSSISSDNIEESEEKMEKVYQETTGNDKVKIFGEFVEWVKDNQEEFAKLFSNSIQISSINIKSQSNTGSGNIINTGIWNGNLGR